VPKRLQSINIARIDTTYVANPISINANVERKGNLSDNNKMKTLLTNSAAVNTNPVNTAAIGPPMIAAIHTAKNKITKAGAREYPKLLHFCFNDNDA
jgi:uncharacterized protein YicC (UPF0701 family)